MTGMTEPVSNSGQDGRGKVLVASCHPDHVMALFHQAIVQLLIQDRGKDRIADVISSISSPRIAASRNMLVAGFLNHPAQPEWMLMLDADMTFPDNLVDDLLLMAHAQERPILSGLYFGGKINGKQRPHAYILAEGSNPPAFNPIEGIGGQGEWGPVVRCHAVGAGCLLMHRSALFKIGERFKDTGFPWFVEGAGGGQEYGEDISFCLRAMHLDIPIHVHTGCILGHVKYGIVDDQSFLTYLTDRDTIGDEAVEQNLLDRYRVGGVVKTDAVETR